jgi:Na+/proline symporter
METLVSDAIFIVLKSSRFPRLLGTSGKATPSISIHLMSKMYRALILLMGFSALARTTPLLNTTPSSIFTEERCTEQIQAMQTA